MTAISAETPNAATHHPLPAPTSALVRSVGDFYVKRAKPNGPERRVEIMARQNQSRLASYMEQRLNHLLHLKPGWDGRRSVPPTDASVKASVRILLAIADDSVLPPYVVPLSDGGLQLEWHVADHGIEIEIDNGGAVHVLEINAQGETVMNDDLENTAYAKQNAIRRRVLFMSSLGGRA